MTQSKKYNPLRNTIAFILTIIIGLQCFSQALESDESFDPFSDYNEFEQDTDEEADINFLKNGRYLTLAMVSGYRGFTDGFSKAYGGNFIYGVQFSYFFDLNIAASLGYTTGDHAVNFSSASTPYTGNVNLQVFDINVKYFFNTDNVTKGLADLNPYALFGTGYYTRTYNLDQEFGEDPDRVAGFRLAGGIEIPVLRRRSYFGFQFLYNFVQFPDENISDIYEGNINGRSPISPRLKGDPYEFNVMFGFNF